MESADYNHIFKTLFGMPPSKDELPLCGAVLPDSWDFPATPRPPCPACEQARQAILDNEAN